jgi:multiple sugar transport system permease protein
MTAATGGGSGAVGRPLWSKVGTYAVMIIFAVFFLFPIVFAVVGSFKDDAFVFADAGSLRGLIPSPFVGLDNYAEANDRVSLLLAFRNSVIISGFIVVLGAVVNSLLGYVLARMQFRGRVFVLTLIVALTIIPFEALAVPLLKAFAEIGWLNTYPVQILPFIANPFFIYLFYTFFLNVPRELEEAARIDGAGPFQTFARVVAPLARPAYASVAILTFLFSWGQLLWPTMVTRGESVRPLPLGLFVFQTTPPLQWGAIMAFVTLMTLPLLAIFLIFQRQFVDGVASSGLKG